MDGVCTSMYVHMFWGEGVLVTATYSSMFQNLWFIIVLAIVFNISDTNLSPKSFLIKGWPELTRITNQIVHSY